MKVKMKSVYEEPNVMFVDYESLEDTMELSVSYGDGDSGDFNDFN